MRVVKLMLAINGATLVMNGVIVWLTIVKAFPPILGIAIFLACLAGAVWFSCYVNGKLPKRSRSATFYSAPTERIESV